jgi:hypothetical protein
MNHAILLQPSLRSVGGATVCPVDYARASSSRRTVSSVPTPVVVSACAILLSEPSI